MMFVARVCFILSLFVDPSVEESVVWMRMSENAVNTVSTDLVMRNPEKVFDLSDLVMTRNQYKIYSVALHSPGHVTSQVQVSKVTNRMFNASWTVSSLTIDVTGEASFLGRTYRIDSRVILKDSSLLVVYQLERFVLLKLAACNFKFNLHSITMRDRSLQSFVSLWRKQFLPLPAAAICYRMDILHRQQPLYMFGLPDQNMPRRMIPTAFKLMDHYLYIAFQKRDGVTSAGTPPDIVPDIRAEVTVFYPEGYIADLTNHLIDGILQKQFIDSGSARIPLTSLAEYFEKAETFSQTTVGYKGVFSIDIKNHKTVVNETGVISTITSTLHYNVTTSCGEFILFSLSWKLKLSYKLVYNDQNVFMLVGDTRSEVTVIESKIGEPKNLSQMVGHLRIKDFLQGAIFEDLAFFLGNPAVLRNTRVTGKENYLLLRSDTSFLSRVSAWKEFGRSFTGDNVTVTKFSGNLGSVDLPLCENTSIRPIYSNSNIFYPQENWFQFLVFVLLIMIAF